MTESTKPWPQEHVDALRSLHAAGLTFAQIAAEMARLFPGRCWTRNAIGAKSDRLGLTGNQQAKPKRPANLPPPLPPSRPFAELQSGGLEPGKSFGELGHAECRWPTLRGEDLLFCGRPVDGRNAYCAHHLAQSTAPYSASLRKAQDQKIAKLIKRVA